MAQKISLDLIAKKYNFARAVQFFVHFFAVVGVATWNFLVTLSMKKMSYVLPKKFGTCIPVRFFYTGMPVVRTGARTVT